MQWRPALAAITGLFVVSRGALMLVAAFLENNIPLQYHGQTFSNAPLLRSLTGSDSNFYLGIAAGGYHAEPVSKGFLDWAFFPFYPVVVKAVSFLTLGDLALAGVLVSNVAFLVALGVVYQLTVRHFDHDTALRSLAFLTFAPGAVAFAMAYSDSLFLALAAGAFLAAEQRRFGWMAVLYALASLTRLQGVLLGIPLAFVIVEAAGGWRSIASWRSRQLVWLVAGPIGFGAFAAYLGARFGDPLGMVTAQKAWSQIGQEPTGPVTPVLDRFDPIVLLLVAVLCFYLFLFLFRRADRPPVAHTVFAIASFGATFVAMLSNTTLIQSFARYMAVVWPFSWTLARRRGPTFELLGIAAFAALFVIYAVLNFTQALAP